MRVDDSFAVNRAGGEDEFALVSFLRLDGELMVPSVLVVVLTVLLARC